MADNIFRRFIDALSPKNNRNQMNIHNDIQYIDSLDNFDDILQKIGSIFSNRMLTSSGQFVNRIQMYNDYEYILKRIPETSKAIQLIISYILKPDTIENEVLLFEGDNSDIIDLQRNIFEYLNVEKLLPAIIHDFLIYGDQYVKVHYMEVTVPTNTLSLTEIKNIFSEQNKLKFIYETDALLQVLERKKKLKIIKEYREYNETKNSIIIDTTSISSDSGIITESFITDSESSNTNVEKKIYIPYKLTIINPKRVVKMENYKINGYLVLPEKYEQQSLFGFDVGMFDRNIQKVLFDNILDTQEIVKKIQNILGTDTKYVTDVLEIIDQEDLKSSGESPDSKIMFYPYSLGILFNFTNIMNTQNLPYGTSVLSQAREMQFYIILLELSTLIYKINRATERRIIRIPVDNVPPEKRAQYIETVKQKFKNNISIDSNGGLQETQQVLSILDDFFVPVINGTPLYEIDVLQGGGNSEMFNNELEYFNKKIIETLNIPYEFFTNQQQGTKLLQQDELFARIVDRYQSLIEDTLNKMLINFFVKLNVLYTTKTIVSLPRPVFFSKLLYYEIQSTKIDYQAKLRDLIDNVPEKYLLKLLDFTDDEINDLYKYREDENNKKLLTSDEENEKTQF